MIALFVHDVQVGRAESGRDALKRWLTTRMSGPRTSVHFVGNHVVDFAPGAGTGEGLDPFTTHLVPDVFPSWAPFRDTAAT